MRRKDNHVLVTTADTLQGIEIVSYQDAIFSTAVVSTGWVVEGIGKRSDYATARFPEFEKRIEEAKEACLRQQKDKATEQRCNLLLGLEFSLSEITSALQNMVGILVSATPAVCREVTKDSSNALPSVIRREDVENLMHEGQAEKLLQEILKLESADVSAQVSDFCSELLKYGIISAEEEMARLFVGLSARNREFDTPAIAQVLCLMDAETLEQNVLEQIWKIKDQIARMLAFVKPSPELEKLYTFLADHPDYELIDSWMEKKNIIFETLVLLPLLKGTKELYRKEDLTMLEKIYDHLTSWFWVPEGTSIKEGMRITADGRIVDGSAREETISAATLQKRQQVPAEVEQMIRILQYLFKQQDNGSVA